jgi:phage terminase large subunit-like protein
MESNRDYGAIATQYARDVVAGRVRACKWVKFACKRHLDDLKNSRLRAFLYTFNGQKAAHACTFIEHLPHTKGKWAREQTGKPGSNLFIMEAWQIFFVCQIFGWVRKSNGLRRYQKVYLCVPRKNGKSSLAAAIGLYMFAADGEYGAEVYSGATSEKQAWEVFRPALIMAKRTPGMCKAFGVQVNASNIHILRNGSRFEPLIGKPGDGSSPSLAIVDEFHEHKTDEQVDTMETGMGAREQPILLVITTAGIDISGPCYAMQLELQKILEGVLTDDQFFGIIYTLDEGDDWTTEEALRKANPNYDISTDGEQLRVKQKRAVQSSRKQNIFKTKNLNIWCGAREAFFNLEVWKSLADPSLKITQFKGEACYGGMDLSSKLDLASTINLFKRDVDGAEHYYVFCRNYLPEETADDPEKSHYLGWVHDGYLTATEGNIIDQGLIKEDILADNKEFHIKQLGYDPYDATKLATELIAEGVDMVEIPQNVRHLSDPMKWLEAVILAKRIHHDGNPILTWAISNVTAKEDANENVFPRKDAAENKIDPAVALIIAMGRALGDAEAPSVYEQRGLFVL